MMEETRSHSPTLHTLRLENNRRLNDLFNRSFAAVGYDIDGVTRLHGDPDPAILDSQALMLSDGMLLAGMTARGESAYFVAAQPLISRLDDLAVSPYQTSFYLTTRNGACTELPFKGSKGEIIDSHPLTNELYRLLLEHPLIQALETLTTDKYIAGLEKLYAKINTKWDLPEDPEVNIHPAILQDRHRIDNLRYKLTVYYNHDVVREALVQDSEKKKAAYRLMEISGGKIPPHPVAMAENLQRVFNEQDIPIALNSSKTDPEIDITISGLDKSTGYGVLKSRVASLYHLPVNKVDSLFLTIGDSPDPGFNDEPLVVGCGVGVTNVNYSVPNGNPIVLDLPGDKLQRARFLFQHITHLKRTV